MLNKVPEITVYFWIIKVLATTVGETAADYLNDTLGFGLTKTTYVMSTLLIVALVAQFWKRLYVPPIYWIAVVLISVVGTLITDNLTDALGVPLVIDHGFTLALAATFAPGTSSERTLSIHSIVTTRREAFYWLAILFTFALGTAAGDLMAERLAARLLLVDLALRRHDRGRCRRTLRFEVGSRCSRSGSRTSSPARLGHRSATSSRSRARTAASASGRPARAHLPGCDSRPWSPS